MKKLTALILALALSLSLCACGQKTEETTQPPAASTSVSEAASVSEASSAPEAAPAEQQGAVMGTMSRLNLTEEEYVTWKKGKIIGLKYLAEQGVYESVKDVSNMPEISGVIFYDTLDAMLMALEAGDISAAEVPQCTADYLVAHNDKLVARGRFDLSKADEFSTQVAARLGEGYSLMTTQDKADLRDALDQALTDMKQDGTLAALVKEYITDAVSTDPQAVEFTQTDGETIRVAITGAFPPMDYVAADGTPAGFNTALLSELGRRMNVNFELMQVDSVGRAAALASGKADLVFWTNSANEHNPIAGKTEEERKAFIEEQKAKGTEEQSELMKAMRDELDVERKKGNDRPDGTIATQSYYSDQLVAVALK